MTHESSPLDLVAIGVPPARRTHSEPSRVAGPGWFDSSWELSRGLEVCERWSDEDRVRGWIDDFLFAQRAVGRTASPSASTAIA